jgi:hyperpolarization activated cyclic nucleotide-gated potassium channel 2
MEGEVLSDEEGASSYGIYPYKAARRIWEYNMYLASLLVVWELPFELAFPIDLTASWVLPSLILDVLFLIDIFISQRTGVLHFGVVKRDKARIMASFPLWRRVIFWLSPWPLYLFGYAFNDLTAFRVLICWKLLRLVRLYDAANRIKNTLIYHSAASWITTLTLILFTIIHVSACIIWRVGRNELPGESWLSGISFDSDERYLIQYFHTVYFITTTVLSIGYGDITPKTFPEVVIVIWIEVIGVFFYHFVVSAMVASVADPEKNSYLSRYQRLYKALKWRGVGEESLRELRRYNEYVWERDRDQVDFYQTREKMPESLQKRLSLALHIGGFAKLDVLRDADIRLLERVAWCLRPRVFTPGDFLIKAGETSKTLYLLTEGKVDILNQERVRVREMEGKNGAIFGEASFGSRGIEPASVVAKTYVEVFELSMEDYDGIEGLRELFEAAERRESEGVDSFSSTDYGEEDGEIVVPFPPLDSVDGQ